MKYKLASSTWDHKEIQAINQVVESDDFTMGRKVKEYESKFAKFLGSKYVIMTNSGSSANLLMIASLFFTKDKRRRLQRGDEVIVPSVSWSTTYFPLQQYGLKVKFVDIDRDTLNLDVKKLESAICDKTKLVLAVNLLGNPNDFDAISKIIKQREITLLEDNCEALGAAYKGKYSGTFGLMGSFSSFYSHHISTMEGGCILTNDEELYQILLSLRAHGWTRDLPKKNLITGLKNNDPFEESFKFVLPGYNVRPLEMSGAIGLEQLKKLPKFISQRRENANLFISTFKDHPYLQTQKEISSSSWFGFSLVIKECSPLSRLEIVNKLAKFNIESRPIVTGNFVKNLDVLKYFNYEISGNLENAEYIDSNGFFIGNHQTDLSREINYAKEVIDNIFADC